MSTLRTEAWTVMAEPAEQLPSAKVPPEEVQMEWARAMVPREVLWMATAPEAGSELCTSRRRCSRTSSTWTKRSTNCRSTSRTGGSWDTCSLKKTNRRWASPQPIRSQQRAGPGARAAPESGCTEWSISCELAIGGGCPWRGHSARRAAWRTDDDAFHSAWRCTSLLSLAYVPRDDRSNGPPWPPSLARLRRAP
eukprot:1923632-Prymnesium_polylepis.1